MRVSGAIGFGKGISWEVSWMVEWWYLDDRVCDKEGNMTGMRKIL